METGIQHRAAVIRFNTDAPNPRTMKAEKQPELVWQCLNCYSSVTQGWWANYNKWGKQKWYGR